jgi:hypothetical protein
VVVHQKFANETERDEKLHSDRRFKLDTNGDVILCDSRATYDVGGHAHRKRSTTALSGLDKRASKDGKKHISKMSVCWDLGRVSSEDGIYITATYDFGAHEPMKSATGGVAPVMGIAIAFLAADITA